MKIAYISQPYPPMISGGGLVTQQLAKGIASRGHEVLVLAPSERGQAYADSTGSLKVVRLRSYPNPMRVGQCFSLWPRSEIASALQTFHPVVVHLCCLLNMGVCGALCARALGIPAVLTIHQLPWFVTTYLTTLPGLRQGIEAVLWSYGRWLLRRCQAAVAPSHTIADMVSARGNPRPQVISNGVNLRLFTPQPAFAGEREALCEAHDLAPELPVILYVGRIDKDKQVDLVIRAAARTLRSVRAQLLVVGDGRERAAVMRLSERLGIGQLSRFPGFVTAEGDLPGLYRLAAVFVAASEVEIQSSVVLEAMASSLPVITVRASSMPELVEDGMTGHLVAPHDVEAMAGRIASLLRDPSQAKAMGQAGRGKAENHSLDSSVKAHEHLYQSLAAQ